MFLKFLVLILKINNAKNISMNISNNKFAGNEIYN